MTTKKSIDISARYIPGFIYLVVSIALLILKFFAYKVTSSDAIFSDAIESVVNVLAASLAFYVLYKSTQTNSQFPYGAGKLEHISSSTEGGLLAFASLAIIFETVLSLINKQSIQELDSGIAIIAVTALANLFLGLYLKNQSKKLKSQALSTSGTHILSDVITTVGVILGLVVVRFTGLRFIDTLMALCLAVFIAYLGFKHLSGAISEILDKTNLELLEKLEKIFNQVNLPGFIQIHQVKIIRSGPHHHIDAHFVMPEFWDVSRIHEELNLLEKKINKSYGYKAEIGAHLDPCRKAYCQHCEVEPCKIRQVNFVKKLPASIDQMQSFLEPDQFMKK